jgi:hypothetical protein
MTTLFSPDQLQHLIDMTIPPVLPEGHTNALVGTVDATGAQIILGFKKDAHGATWEFQGGYRHEWSGDDIGSGKLIVSW